MNSMTLKAKHLGNTTLMFGVRVIALKSATRADGPDDQYLEVLASGTKTDTHVERMSEEILKFMLGQAKLGKVILVENHQSSLRMGTSVDGRLATNADGELELYQTFKLEPNSSTARDLVAQMSDPVNPYIPDCSVGLLNVAVEEMYDDDTGEHYKILLPIPETIYEHLALTRPDGQAYPDAALLAVGGKNALREITAKSLTAALDCVMIQRGTTPPGNSPQETDNMNANYKQLLKARAAQVKAAISKIGLPHPGPLPGPGPVPPGPAPGAPGDVTPSGEATTPTAPAFPMPEEGDDKSKLAPADAIQDDPMIRCQKEIDECRAKLKGLEEMATKDEGAITEAKAKLKGFEENAAKLSQPDPNANAAKTKEEGEAAALAKAKADADAREAAAAKGVELNKEGEDVMMGYGTIDGAKNNVKGMREMLKAFTEDQSVSPEQWGELAGHLHDELEMLETGLSALSGGETTDAAKAIQKARGGVTNIVTQSNKQVLDEIISLRAQVQKLGEAAVQRVPARLNDPSQLPAAEQAKLSIREQLMKIKDPAERERASYELVQKLNASLRNPDEPA